MAKDEPEIFFFAFRKNVSKENLSKWNKLTEISNHSSRIVLPLFYSQLIEKEKKNIVHSLAKNRVDVK